MTCHKVYEDVLFLGFLDIHPRTRGHSLLIPKKHYTWVYDVPEFGEYWNAAKKLTNALQQVLSPHFVTFVTHGLEVPHAHIHIMPRKKDETAFVPGGIETNDHDLKALSTEILAHTTNVPSRQY